MTNTCEWCHPPGRSVLLRNESSQLLVPRRLHIPPEDGGHLIVTPSRHIPNRAALAEREVLDIWRLSLVASNLLSAIFSVEWFNYQENGNWTIDRPDAQHMHLHIYGRARSSTSQPFGEALRFPRREELPQWDVDGYTEAQMKSFRSLVSHQMR